MSAELTWIRLGIVAGFATCLAYPAAVFLPLPTGAAVLLAAALGPLLGVACIGLSRLLRVAGNRVCADLGAVMNLLAGCLFSTMLLVQLAVRMRAESTIERTLVAVWLGLDVAWDVYIALGTVLFALSMWRHPRFGRVFGASGLLIATALLALNLATFPEPPAESALVDLGPLVGLWYLCVTVQAVRSIPWFRECLEGAQG